MNLEGESKEVILTVCKFKDKMTFLTLPGDQVSHDQCESVTREDVVSTVDMVAIDGQSPS